VGGFYTEAEARELMETTGCPYAEDSGRGWRRLVASPMPVDIYEKISLKTLVDAGQVVIACGGGGIPVVYRGSRYMGVDAVIDKDFAAAKLADLVEADVFIVLTAVDRVYLRYNQPGQEAVSEMSVETAKKYIAAGHFAPGSILPKVQAACMFAEGGKNRRAIIGSLEKASLALGGESGTTIHL
jgi:carbamate kinase